MHRFKVQSTTTRTSSSSSSFSSSRGSKNAASSSSFDLSLRSSPTSHRLGSLHDVKARASLCPLCALVIDSVEELKGVPVQDLDQGCHSASCSLTWEIDGREGATTGRNLANPKNLVRGLTMEVPSGQRVAAAMQEVPLHETDLADLEPFGLHKRTPLWFYVLREADVRADGEHLGPVGGRIVAEVFHGLIDGDPSSYLSQDPDWTPTYGTDDDFGITDLLTAAGVVGALA